MKTVLITGFEPFGGESVNPSWEVVSGLDNAIIGGCRVVARQLPCVFGESLAVLNGAIDALSPSLVLAVGQAGGARMSPWSAWRSTLTMRVLRIIRVNSR
jgi:pyroglutamyl-peptidase